MTKKKEKTALAEKLFKKIFKLDLVTLRNYEKHKNGGEGIPKVDGLNDTYIFNFYDSAYGSSSFATSTSEMYGTPMDSIDGDNIVSDNISIDSSGDDDKLAQKKPIKIKVKPKDVLDQLETVPRPFDLILIDEKIGMLQDKKELIRPGAESERYAKRELNGLIERLENRKKYNDFKEYFDKFDNTTEEKIDKLLEKYELVMKPSDIFIPDFPDDAIKTMTEYTAKSKELCGKKPVFYVIAEATKFKKNYEKRDPILLVQSPFGFYWQILGAWDEEMLILHCL